MALYTYTIENHSFIAHGAGNALPPCLTFADVAVFNLTLAGGVLADGDILTVAIDSNMEFYDPLSATGDATVMAVAHKTLGDSDSKTNVEIEVPLGSETFRSRVNGLEKPLRVHVGLYVTRNGVYQELALGLMDARPVVAGPNAVSPVLPVTEYPTREEAVAIKDEALEAVGKAKEEADRAEAAAAGIVPPLQLSSPPTTSTVGSVGQLAVWHDAEATDQSKADHEYHLLYIVESVGGKEYIWREDVTENKRNVAGGFAGLDANALVLRDRLPICAGDSVGVIRIGASHGFRMSNKYLILHPAENASINTRNDNTNGNGAVMPSNLDYAVRSVLPNVTEIPAATSDYSLVDSSATTNNHSMTYRHEPQTPSVYHLPAVAANSTVLHEIVLSVKFSSTVLTYEFQDSNGTTLVPLPLNGDIEAGSVVTFLCRYSPLLSQWVIYPIMDGKEAE